MSAEVAVRSIGVEKTLQSLIERHLDKFLSVQFLASEYSTGETHKGRIDTLGIDENGCPVIIEYKRALTRTSSSRDCSTSTGYCFHFAFVANKRHKVGLSPW